MLIGVGHPLAKLSGSANVGEYNFNISLQVSFAVSVQANNPILSVFDKDYYEVGKTSSELQLDKDTVYRILAERYWCFIPHYYSKNISVICNQFNSFDF